MCKKILTLFYFSLFSNFVYAQANTECVQTSQDLVEMAKIEDCLKSYLLKINFSIPYYEKQTADYADKLEKAKKDFATSEKTLKNLQEKQRIFQQNLSNIQAQIVAQQPELKQATVAMVETTEKQPKEIKNQQTTETACLEISKQLTNDISAPKLDFVIGYKALALELYRQKQLDSFINTANLCFDTHHCEQHKEATICKEKDTKIADYRNKLYLFKGDFNPPIAACKLQAQQLSENIMENGEMDLTALKINYSDCLKQMNPKGHN